MRIKPFFIIIFLLVGITIFFKLDHTFREGVLSLGDEVKSFVFDTKNWGKEIVLQYFNQAQNIQDLSSKLEEMQKIELENMQLTQELKKLTSFYNMPSLEFKNVFPIKAISYYEIGNYDRIWLDGYADKEKGKIYGLILNGTVVGIAKIVENQRLMGLLNGDPLCSYGVYVGDEKAPGIIRGSEEGIEVDYIPIGSKISVGDKVVTNGMDQIFFENIPVGEIIKITQGNGYLRAKIKTYAPKVDLGYMWLLDRSNDAEQK